MKATDFIKTQGLDKAREVVEGAPEHCTTYTTGGGLGGGYIRCSGSVGQDEVSISDLKRLVESADLIGKYHSIDHAKNHYNNMREALNQYQYENKDIEDLSNELKQAIADVEACQAPTLEDLGDDTNLENRISPLCKVQ